MLDDLKALFNKELQFPHTAQILNQLGNVLSMIQVQYLKDQDAKNTAIDVICQILQSHKDVVSQGDTNAAN
jgi:hypothetical protein